MVFPLATRVQAVTLKNCGYTWENIEKQTGIKKAQLQRIIIEAKHRGYSPDVCPTLKDEYFHNGTRLGRPTKLSQDQVAVLVAASKPSEGLPRKSTRVLAKEFGVSERTIRRSKERQGKNTRLLHRPQQKDLAVTNAEIQSVPADDAEMFVTSSTEDQASFDVSLVRQLELVASGEEYATHNSPQLT